MMRWSTLMALLLMTAVPAVAQNVLQETVVINLDAAFLPDPFLVSLIGGGTTDAANLDNACSGFLTEQPTASLNLRDLGEGPLTIFFYSSHDTVLIIQQPDGSYRCNDDMSNMSPPLLDPLVMLDNPADGEYRIWVGTYNEGQIVPGFLVFTQSDTVNPETLDISQLVIRSAIPKVLDEAQAAAALNLNAAASMNVETGSGPNSQMISGGGELYLPALGFDQPACTGFIGIEPSLVFNFSGTTENLRLFVESEQDTVLVVETPDNQFYCNDDYVEDNLNPVVDVANPTEGLYRIFMGSVMPTQEVDGNLTITESADAQPQQLNAQENGS